MDAGFPALKERDAARAAMLAHPEHHLPAVHRMPIYRALGAYDTPRGKAAHTWLGILAAQHVISIYETADLGALGDELEPDPHLLLDFALRIAEGKLDPEAKKVKEAMEASYHSYGNLWFEELPVNAGVAIYATRKALLAAYFPPLQHVDRLSMRTPGGGRVSGWELTDEHLGGIEVGDTAATAALAYASTAESSHCDPDRLLRFWTWWLDEALRAAWERAGT